MMFEKFKTKVTIDDLGVKEFIKLCKTKSEFTKEDIENLLSNSSYNKLIELGGPNIGMKSRNMWIEIFYFGLNKMSSDVNEKNDYNKWQKNIIEEISWAYEHVDKIESVYLNLMNVIKEGRFIEISKGYVPDTVNMEEFRINLVVFANNCFGIDKDMIIDVPFMRMFSEEGISRILAHELHHMLRAYVSVEYDIQEKYKGIGQSLFWLESEGTANLCNFKDTCHLYEECGYVEKGKIKETLDNINLHLVEMNNILLKVLDGSEESKKLVSYLGDNCAFHTFGFYMATKIKEVLGVEKLRESVGDSLKFFKYYNEAAKVVNNTEEIFIFNEEIFNSLDKIYFTLNL